MNFLSKNMSFLIISVSTLNYLPLEHFSPLDFTSIRPLLPSHRSTLNYPSTYLACPGSPSAPSINPQLPPRQTSPALDHPSVPTTPPPHARRRKTGEQSPYPADDPTPPPLNSTAPRASRSSKRGEQSEPTTAPNFCNPALAPRGYQTCRAKRAFHGAQRPQRSGKLSPCPADSPPPPHCNSAIRAPRLPTPTSKASLPRHRTFAPLPSRPAVVKKGRAQASLPRRAAPPAKRQMSRWCCHFQPNRPDFPLLSRLAVTLWTRRRLDATPALAACGHPLDAAQDWMLPLPSRLAVILWTRRIASKTRLNRTCTARKKRRCFPGLKPGLF